MAETKGTKEEAKIMSVYEKLMIVQQKLKAPKGQFNKFGNYSYRSCEDILEAVKPLLAEVRAFITISDEITIVGDRFYVMATVHFVDAEGTHEEITNTAYAREALTRKGSDESQITGATSSYARKYALNGLLVIDDTKDPDANESHTERENRDAATPKKAPRRQDTPEEAKLNEEMRASVDPDLLPDPKRTPEYRAERIRARIAEKKQDEALLMQNAKVKDWLELSDAKFVSLMGWLERK